jgi:preprotein translocase subunit SecF
VAAIIALAHDLLIVISITALLAKIMPFEISSMYLVGLLTVLGYSVNDTIVVFDRLRENILKGVTKDFVTTVNFSIIETLGRSLNTSLTTLLVLASLIFLGPESTKPFIIVLTIGVISGTYSSLFIASQIIVSWETRSLGKLRGADTQPQTK